MTKLTELDKKNTPADEKIKQLESCLEMMGKMKALLEKARERRKNENRRNNNQ